MTTLTNTNTNTNTNTDTDTDTDIHTRMDICIGNEDTYEYNWRRISRRRSRQERHDRLVPMSKSMMTSMIMTIVTIMTFTMTCHAFTIKSSFIPTTTTTTATSTASTYTNTAIHNYNYQLHQLHNIYQHQSFSNSKSNSNSNSKSSTCLYMGKGDGKKKRKKKTAATSSNGATATATATAIATPPPMRVTNNSLIPVKRQIRWAQMKKEAMRNSGTSFRQTNFKRTRYRKSLDEAEIEQAKIERQKKGQDVNWDVILNATASTPLVIVDGYNIIHKYPRLKKWITKGMLSKARNMLIHDMEELRALKGWRIEVVFDGYGRDVNGPLGSGSTTVTVSGGNTNGNGNGNGNTNGYGNDNNGATDSREKIAKTDQEATKKVTDNGVRVVFSGVGMSADGYIEGRCYDAKKVTDGKLTGSLIIATDDNLIRSAGASAGAVSMSADRLIDELRALRKSTMYRVEAAVAKANGHAMRPEKLMGTILPSKLTRGAIIIEDKRNRPKKRKKKEDGEQVRTLDDLKKGTTSLPSWAVVPPKDNKL